jgi:hypothetical protein
MGPLVVLLVVVLQAAVLGMLLEALHLRDVAAAVNASVTVAAVVLLTAAGGAFADPALLVWLSIAGVLPSLGLRGLYDTNPWWDHLTHTVSAGLVAALAYAWLLPAGAPTTSWSPAPTAAATAVVAAFAVGVLWEVVELVAREVGDWLDIDPMLVVYGWEDTAYDLVFDVVGAVLVVALDLRVFVPLVEQLA